MRTSGLPVLFFTELLERFAFYAIAAIFTLYLTEHLQMSIGDASGLYGTVFGLIYVAPLLGGVLADRALGHVRALLLGAPLLALGYALLILDSRTGHYPALLALVAGHGLFKIGVMATLARLYPRSDPRRESAFIILFLAIDLGGGLAPLAAAAARNHLGWGGVFATSAVAMAGAALLAAVMRRRLAPAEVPAEPPRETGRTSWSLPLLMYLIWTLFRVAPTQYGSLLVFWARDHTDLTLGGLLAEPLDPEIFSAADGLFQLLLAPMVIGLFYYLRRSRLEPSAPAKVGMGMVLMAVSSFVLVMASLELQHTERISALWLLGAYLAMALPNLFLAPIMLALLSRLVPQRSLGTYLGIWFFLGAGGNKVGGELGRLWVRLPPHHFIGLLGLVSLLATGLWISQVRRLEAALREATD